MHVSKGRGRDHKLDQTSQGRLLRRGGAKCLENYCTRFRSQNSEVSPGTADELPASLFIDFFVTNTLLIFWENRDGRQFTENPVFLLSLLTV